VAAEVPFCNWCQTAQYVGELLAGIATGQFDWRDLLDPTGLLGIFGRNKLGPGSASDNAALAFLYSQNPVFRMYGLGIRALEAQGIPISSTSAKLSILAQRVFNDLVDQFGAQYGKQVFDKMVANNFQRACTDNVNNACLDRIHVIDVNWYENFRLKGWLDRQGKPTSSNPYSKRKSCVCVGG
jgi:hypothetical protein